MKPFNISITSEEANFLGAVLDSYLQILELTSAADLVLPVDCLKVNDIKDYLKEQLEAGYYSKDDLHEDQVNALRPYTRIKTCFAATKKMTVLGMVGLGVLTNKFKHKPNHEITNALRRYMDLRGSIEEIREACKGDEIMEFVDRMISDMSTNVEKINQEATKNPELYGLGLPNKLFGLENAMFTPEKLDELFAHAPIEQQKRTLEMLRHYEKQLGEPPSVIKGLMEKLDANVAKSTSAFEIKPGASAEELLTGLIGAEAKHKDEKVSKASNTILSTNAEGLLSTIEKLKAAGFEIGSVKVLQPGDKGYEEFKEKLADEKTKKIDLEGKSPKDIDSDLKDLLGE